VPWHREARWLTTVPADRADQKNLRYRRHLAHPWISAALFWVVLFVVLAVPTAIAILHAGGIPPSPKYATDSEYFGWTGSPAKGRSSAIWTLVGLGAALGGLAVVAGWKTRNERDEVRRIDAERIAAGVPRLAHNTTPPLEHKWFGVRRRRRQVLAQVPMPRAESHEQNRCGHSND
jgi:hypothetical protein